MTTSVRTRLGVLALTMGLGITVAYFVWAKWDDDVPTRTRVGARGIDARVLPVPNVDGLSGLTSDDRGRLWAIPERARFLLVLRDERAELSTIPLVGVDPDLDTESIAWLGGSRFALGTEAARDARRVHAILVAEVRGAEAKVTSTLHLELAEAGLEPEENQGIEGLCFAGGWLVAAFETARDDATGRTGILALRRWPEERSFRYLPVALTSTKGKLAALDCAFEEGRLVLHAIERHFETMRILRFELSPDAPSSERITPIVVRDLAALVEGTPNPEGLVVRGRHAFVVIDNHYGRRRGPNELLRITLPERP